MVMLLIEYGVGGPDLPFPRLISPSSLLPPSLPLMQTSPSWRGKCECVDRCVMRALFGFTMSSKRRTLTTCCSTCEQSIKGRAGE